MTKTPEFLLSLLPDSLQITKSNKTYKHEY